MYQIAASEQQDVRAPKSVRVRPESRAARRLAWGAACSLATGTLSAARWLVPDARGYGTHTQLGLPPCGFHLATGAPCPLCGLTTSFAHMARFELTSAMMSHPLGAPLFALTVLAVPACAWACLRATPIVETNDRSRLRRAALALVGIVALVWIVRLMLPLAQLMENAT